VEVEKGQSPELFGMRTTTGFYHKECGNGSDKWETSTLYLIGQGLRLQIT
jgi:hypothetical protein